MPSKLPTREEVINDYKKNVIDLAKVQAVLKHYKYEAIKPDELNDGDTLVTSKKSNTSRASTRTVKTKFSIRRKSREDKKFLNMLVYGDFGSGKTTLASTSEFVDNMGDVLFINIDAGDEVLPEDTSIDIIDIGAYKEIESVREFLIKHIKYRDADDEEKLRALESKFTGIPEEEIEVPRRYYTVIIDSLTEVQKYCMYQLLGVEVGSWQLDMPPDNPQFKQWGQSREMIQFLIRNFRALDMHTIFIASRRMQKDESSRMHYAPALPGQLATDVMGMFDAVGYLTIDVAEKKQIRRLRLVPGRTYAAKHRFVKFKGTVIEDPTMQRIMNVRRSGNPNAS